MHIQGVEAESVQLSQVVALHSVCKICENVRRKQGFDSGRVAFISLTTAN